MNTVVVFSFVLLSVVSFCLGDIYMHNMRGSNNRLDEKSATRTNNNRLFDSQNNARGGYNVGDLTNKAAGNDQEKQYRMKFFQSAQGYQNKASPAGRSELVVEWTNQHGCGGNEDTDPHKQNCNIVIQASCQEDSAEFAPADGITFRDGSSTNTIGYQKIDSNSKKDQFAARKADDISANRGLQEPWFWYDSCRRRHRNKGLFTATQNLQKDDASSTRQNPNGNRYGYECPEEKDYFPYWHPTPFFDVAILAQNETLCSYYNTHSANRAGKYQCIENFDGSNDVKHFSEHNNQADCEANGGTWTQFFTMLELAPSYTTKSQCESNHGDGMSYKWGKPWDPKKFDAFQAIEDVCFVQPPEIDCKAAGWTRSNHLGNGREGVPLNYTWTLPYFPSATDKRCVLRIRYNISTDDYDPYNTDSTQNGDNSPVQQNPLVDVGANAQALRLAINTAQFGRTFQDRSHVFILRPRPADFDANARIINLNVRGKRGNIVQTYPAVEYDFIPNRLTVSKNTDYIHVQWTGSNTHDNDAPGGDGQTGDAGEGTGGTDRHNLLECSAPDVNFPTPAEKMTMFKNAEVMWSPDAANHPVANADIPIHLASVGYYHCIKTTPTCSKSVEGTATVLNNQLNDAPASFEGIVFKYNKAGKYYYICTRNNNFTNRSQKGHIYVK